MSFDDPGGLYGNGPQQGFAQPDGSYWSGPDGSSGSAGSSGYDDDTVYREEYREDLTPGRPRRRRRASQDSWLFSAFMGALGFGVAGLILWVKFGLILSNIRATLEIFLPSSWFTAGNSVGTAGLRGFVVVFTGIVFVALTIIRMRVAAAWARSESGGWLSAAVGGLSVVRVLLVAAAIAVYFRADALSDSTAPDTSPFGAPIGTWPWFATTWLPWIVFVLIVISFAGSSAWRARRRASTVTARRAERLETATGEDVG